MRNSTTGSILGVAVMAVVFAAGASAHNGRATARQVSPAPASKPTAAAPIGMVQDWTNEHVMFRNVETPEEAKAKGRYERWKEAAFQYSWLLATADPEHYGRLSRTPW